MKQASGKRAVIVLLFVLVFGVAIQFIRPSLGNRPATAGLAAPPEVKAILQRACYDCHSNQTKLAWFDQPVPAYWLVVKDVRAGRKVLNFSNWGSLPKAQQAGKLYEALNQVEFHVMPLSNYTLLHHDAVITPEEVTVLRQYLLTLAPKAVPDTAKERIAMTQFAKWTQTPTDTAAVKAASNGISYHELAGFGDWKAISTTERFDNGTLRVIMGNDIAVAAIRQGQTHPWPRGATFAKVAWDQLPDSAGEIHAGAFKQVEFMIRDNDQYAATDGWGFARWVGGLGLKPYGKDAGFTTECVNCHSSMGAYDHVFTLPLADTLGLYDQAAYLPDSVAAHPLAGRVITSFVSHHQGATTMSTLYGNDIAVKSARAGQPVYAAGSVLALVTWSQRDDPHWFGGRIPAGLKSIELVSVGPGLRPAYSAYEGMPMVKKADSPADVQERIQYITSQKASVFP
jgi:Haem-binding domain/Cytochrome P460